MFIRSLGYAAATALCFVASTGAASVIDVSISGMTAGASAGGPYTVSGGFSFDTLAPGATTALNNVSILDPGIFDFSVAFTGGTFDTTFSDPLEPIVNLGSFNLSNFGTFSNIANSNVCLQKPGGNGLCNSGSPGGILTFNILGQVSFSPDQSNSFASATGGFGQVSYTVSERMPPVPLPASLPLFLVALGAAAFVKRKKTIRDCGK